MARYFRLNGSTSTTPVAFRSDEFTTETRLREIRAHMDAAATTSEDLTVTIESFDDATYDTVIYRIDLSASSTVDISNTGRSELILPGDRLRVDYANTNGVNVAWQLILSDEV